VSTSKYIESYPSELLSIYETGFVLKKINCGSKRAAMALRLRLYGLRRAMEKTLRDQPDDAILFDIRGKFNNACGYAHLVKELGGSWYVVLEPHMEVSFTEDGVPVGIAPSLLEREAIRTAVAEARAEEPSEAPLVKRTQELQDEVLSMLGFTPGKRSVEDKQPGNSVPESQERLPSARPTAKCARCGVAYWTDLPENFNFGDYCSAQCKAKAELGVKPKGDMDF